MAVHIHLPGAVKELFESFQQLGRLSQLALSASFAVFVAILISNIFPASTPAQLVIFADSENVINTQNQKGDNYITNYDSGSAYFELTTKHEESMSDGRYLISAEFAPVGANIIPSLATEIQTGNDTEILSVKIDEANFGQNRGNLHYAASTFSGFPRGKLHLRIELSKKPTSAVVVDWTPRKQ